MFVLAARLLRSDTEPGELQMVPHNITTEMELQLWALTQRIRADAAGSEALRGSLAAELARRFGAGALPPASCRAASPVPVPLRPSRGLRRSTSEFLAGRRTRRTSSVC